MKKDVLLDFISFLNDIYVENKVCVFYELAGHVDWFQYRITYSKKEYAFALIEDKINIDDKYFDKKSIFYKKRTFEETFEYHKRQILQAIEKKEPRKNALVRKEIETLKKLKEKYPNI